MANVATDTVLAHTQGHLQDETRTAMAPRLHYEETYAIEMEDAAMTSSSIDGPGTMSMTVLVITVDPCLKMVADPNMCRKLSPPLVSKMLAERLMAGNS